MNQVCVCGRKATRECKRSSTDYGHGNVQTTTEIVFRCGYHCNEHSRYEHVEEVRKL